MARIPRYTKLFSETGRRRYAPDGKVSVERPKKPVDELVNTWVDETGNVIVQVSSSRHTVMEKEKDGTLVRKTTTQVMVVYQSEEDFLETETQLRRQTLVPQMQPSPADRPTEKTDTNAGAPEGLGEYLPADPDEDDDL